jgi:nucleotide-binding universal stress UspA family protein
LPITVLPLSEGALAARKGRPPDDSEDGAAQWARSAIAAAAAVAEDSKRAPSAEDQATSINVTVRKTEARTKDAVAQEARKGYDLLFAGIENTRTKSGDFHQDITRVSEVFRGPIAIVEAAGRHFDAPEQSALNILVPVNGTEVSRRGAEVAIVIARVLDAPLTALYVSRPPAKDGPPGRYRAMRLRGREHAILKDIVELAERCGHRIQTAVRADIDAELAISSQLRSGTHNLVVMGVARRVGDELYFGDPAALCSGKRPLRCCWFRPERTKRHSPVCAASRGRPIFGRHSHLLFVVWPQYSGPAHPLPWRYLNQIACRNASAREPADALGR